MAEVPFIPTVPRLTPIKNGLSALSADTWVPLASTSNWLHGSGTQVIAGYSPVVVIGADSQERFYFRVPRSPGARYRLWHLIIHTFSEPGVADTASGEIVIDDGDPMPYSVPAPGGSVEFLETLGEYFDPLEDIEVAITSIDTSSIILYVACTEVPATSLTPDENEWGSELVSYRSGSVILDDEGRSVTHLARAVSAARQVATRGSLLAWNVPDDSSAVRQISYSHGETEILSVPPVVVPRSLYGDSVASVRLVIRASGGGIIRITAPSGDSESWAHSSGDTSTGDLETYTFSSGTVDVLAEDVSSVSGVSTLDHLSITAEGPTELHTIRISGVYLIEEL